MNYSMLPSSIVFLVDVDDTLLENDRIQDDLRAHMERAFGPECRALAAYPNAADVTVDRIGDLLAYEVADLLAKNPRFDGARERDSGTQVALDN
jgi:hypothetical protein